MQAEVGSVQGINGGDTAWMLVATAMVMVMLPGLALFYGGLVRRKNVLSTIMHSFFGLAIVSVLWVLIGFSLAFGHDITGLGLLGGSDYVGFSNVGLEPNQLDPIPDTDVSTTNLMFYSELGGGTFLSEGQKQILRRSAVLR